MPSLSDIVNYLKAPAPVHGQKNINPYMKAGRDAAVNYGMNMSQRLGEDLIDTAKHPENIVGPGEFGMLRVPNPLRVYHGSPHDFDRFDISKIGTGEGAQSYGHGLYFAENPKVAKSYKSAGVGGPMYKIDDKIYHVPNYSSEDPSVQETALSVLHLFEGNKDAAINALVNSKYGSLHEASAADWLNKAKNIERYKGRMYEADLHADPSHMVDYDAHFDEQSPYVQKSLQGLFGNRKLFNSLEDITKYTRAGRYGAAIPKNEYGMKAFRDVGIPGLKFLDQESRDTLQKPWAVTPKDNPFADLSKISTFRTQEDANRHLNSMLRAYPNEEGGWAINERPRTSNYVAFDDNIIDLLKKYGAVGLPAAGVVGAAANQTSQPDQPTDMQQ